MDDLISRSALYDALKDLASKTDCDIAILPDVADLIREAPAIDPESLRPHGRWIKYNGYTECSECEHWYDSPETEDPGDRPMYCHNCGAKMDLPDQVLAPTDQPATQYADNPTLADAWKETQ